VISRPFANVLAPLLLAAGIALSLASWYLEPGRRGVAAALLVVTVALAAAFVFGRRRARRNPSRFVAVDDITKGVAFVASTIVLALGGSLARTVGVVDDPDIARRATMIVFGLLLFAIGNGLPKTLTPMSALQCDGARLQAFQRATGWIWALTGLSLVALWAILPIAAARPVSLTLIAAALLIAAKQLLSLVGPHRPAA
jgi:hypothetical protein